VEELVVVEVEELLTTLVILVMIVEELVDVEVEEMLTTLVTLVTMVEIKMSPPLLPNNYKTYFPL